MVINKSTPQELKKCEYCGDLFSTLTRSCGFDLCAGCFKMDGPRTDASEVLEHAAGICDMVHEPDAISDIGRIANRVNHLAMLVADLQTSTNIALGKKRGRQ
jgi:hypothetical protein